MGPDQEIHLGHPSLEILMTIQASRHLIRLSMGGIISSTNVAISLFMRRPRTHWIATHFAIVFLTKSMSSRVLAAVKDRIPIDCIVSCFCMDGARCHVDTRTMMRSKRRDTIAGLILAIAGAIALLFLATLWFEIRFSYPRFEIALLNGGAFRVWIAKWDAPDWPGQGFTCIPYPFRVLWRVEYTESATRYIVLMPLWIPIVVLFSIGILVRRRRTMLGQCRHCGYDITDVRSAGNRRCPECGREFANSLG